MTLKQLRELIADLPEDFDAYNVVNGEVGLLDPEDETSAVYRVDNPIIAMYVDKKTEEVCFFHQTQEDVRNVFDENHNEDDNSSTQPPA